MRAEHLWATPEPLPPVAGLTVAVEKWDAKHESRNARVSVRRVAVLDLDRTRADRWQVSCAAPSTSHRRAAGVRAA